MSTLVTYWPSRKTLVPASGWKFTRHNASSQVPVSRSCSVPVRAVPVTFTLVQPPASASKSGTIAHRDARIVDFRCIVNRHR